MIYRIAKSEGVQTVRELNTKKKELVDIALGKEKADLVLKNANLVNVCSGEIY